MQPSRKKKLSIGQREPLTIPREYQAVMVQIQKAVQALSMAVDYLNSAQMTIRQMATEKQREAEQLKKIEEKFESKPKPKSR